MSKLSGILHEGPSPITGEPIVVIATVGSRNEKTGDMVQVWILRANADPHDARKANADTAVCGHCPLAGYNKGCYVSTFHAPRTIYKAYQRGLYKPISPESLAGRAIRWGAYGDPALIPLDIVTRANRVALKWTGYTHQWHKPWGERYRGVFMASVESRTQEARLNAEGWGTFRAGLRDGSDQGDAMLCKNERDGTSCFDCGACNGAPLPIFIPAHGTYAKYVPVERSAAKRRLEVV